MIYWGLRFRCGELDIAGWWDLSEIGQHVRRQWEQRLQERPGRGGDYVVAVQRQQEPQTCFVYSMTQQQYCCCWLLTWYCSTCTDTCRSWVSDDIFESSLDGRTRRPPRLQGQQGATRGCIYRFQLKAQSFLSLGIDPRSLPPDSKRVLGNAMTCWLYSSHGTADKSGGIWFHCFDLHQEIVDRRS